MKKGLKNLYKGLVVSFATLTGIAFTGTIIANENASIINTQLGFETTQQIHGGSKSFDSQYFKSKYDKLSDVVEAGKKTVAKVEEEGAVLLKNENNALPLADKAKVSLVGVSSIDPVFSGTGSGETSSSSFASMKDSFKEAGLDVNETLWNFYLNHADQYKRVSRELPSEEYFKPTEFLPNDAPFADLQADGTVYSSLQTYGDAAIFTISRVGGEANDLPWTNKDGAPGKILGVTYCNEEGDYLDLTDNEVTILKGLKQMKDEGKIKKVVVLFNSANAFETDFLDDEQYGVDAAMWIGTTGTSGLLGVGRLLTNKDGANPSGRLSDTYFTDNITYNPVLANFGDYTFTNGYPTLAAKLGQQAGRYMGNYAKYLVYAEGVYLGYRYTETRYYDSVMGVANVGDYDYDRVVDYPFGYGLSYTTFSYSDFSLTYDAEKDVFTASVKVTNTGSKAGKEVVQFYANRPYTDYDKENGIEKSAVDLVAYGKSELIKPGENEVVTSTFTGRQLASYDENKAKTYILDGGDYYFTAGKDAHDATNNFLANQGKTAGSGMTQDGDASLVKSQALQFSDTKYAKSDLTEKEITNLFEDGDYNHVKPADAQGVTYMSRKDWEGTYPSNPHLSMDDKMLEKEMAPLTVPQDSEAYPTYGKETKIQLIEMKQDKEGNPIPYESQAWEDFLDQLTWDETVGLVTHGLRSTYAVSRIGKLATRDTNGPIGLTQPFGEGVNGLANKKKQDLDKKIYPASYPCAGIMAATFSDKIAEEIGDMMGEEALWAGYSGLYGPCSNLHRSPYEGRCFEYYSEDATLSGLFLGHQVEKIQEHGCYVYNKHFAMNDQETNRGGVCTFATEQNIRENYLRSFEYTIRIGDAKCVMTSMSRIGLTAGYASKVLSDDFLRGELGMSGISVTDFWGSAKVSSVVPVDLGAVIYNGENIPDGNLSDAEVAAFSEAYKTGYGKLAKRMRESAHRILYTVAHSNAMNGIAPGDYFTDAMPSWQVALTVADISLSVLTVAAVVMLVLGLTGVFPKKEA